MMLVSEGLMSVGNDGTDDDRTKFNTGEMVKPLKLMLAWQRLAMMMVLNYMKVI